MIKKIKNELFSAIAKDETMTKIHAMLWLNKNGYEDLSFVQKIIIIDATFDKMRLISCFC